MCDINTNHRPRADRAPATHPRAKRTPVVMSAAVQFSSTAVARCALDATSRARRRAANGSRASYRDRIVSREGDTATGSRARGRGARARTRVFERGFRFEGISRVARGDRAARKRARGRGGADVRTAIGRGGTGRDARGDARGASDSTPSAAPPRARERREGATARGEAARRDARREGGMGWTGRERDERATDDERAISRMQFARGEGAKASKLEDARERRDATDVDAGCDRAGALEERVAG